MDHNTDCGDPDLTSHLVHLGGGDYDSGQTLPASATDPAFMSCAPGADPAKAHLMTAMNTSGYAVLWFSPKQFFMDVHRVCVSVSMVYMGNDLWWQMMFLSPTEVAHKPVANNGQPINVLDLGYTSPEFPRVPNSPSTLQGTAGNGVKFDLIQDAGIAGQARFNILPWNSGAFRPTISFTRAGGMDATGAHAKAPRFPTCVTDNENGTLTIAFTDVGNVQRSATVAGSIPNGQVRVVFAHDGYNPDKHHSSGGGPIPDNSGVYTIHWDDIVIS